MKQWMTALSTLAMTMINTSCTPLVIDPVQPGGSSGGGGGSSAAGPPSAIAILAKDVPMEAPMGIGVPILGDNTDPDALVLMWSNGPEACQSPQIGGTCPDQTVWQGILVLPSDLVRVGLVDLANPRIESYSFTYYDAMCSGGGGGGTSVGGTLEIVSTDAGSITVNLVTALPGSAGATINGVDQPPVMLQGMYTLSRCEAAPAPPPPSAAVAIRGSALPPGLSSPSIGASPDPTALYVFLGSATQTCADPLSPLGCTGDGRIVLRIPAALQQPGALDLSDPQIAASIAIAANDGTANCTSTSGTFTQGTMTIHSVDAGGISFSLYQSLVASPSGPNFDADGLYQATVCP